MLLLTIFAGLALLLAAIGIYGLMSYTVEQRTQELGIRMALGASRGDMLKLVVRQGLLLAGSASWLVSPPLWPNRLLADLLFGVKATDPVTYAAVTVILISVAVLASYIPARKAIQIDPMMHYGTNKKIRQNQTQIHRSVFIRVYLWLAIPSFARASPDFARTISRPSSMKMRRRAIILARCAVSLLTYRM